LRLPFYNHIFSAFQLSGIKTFAKGPGEQVLYNIWVFNKKAAS
jgi:hypothetical protein